MDLGMWTGYRETSGLEYAGGSREVVNEMKGY